MFNTASFRRTHPIQLLYSTQIPIRLWFLTKSKSADAKLGLLDRRERVKELALAA
jgi:hypothetical protein